jgi:hypothetical protein
MKDKDIIGKKFLAVDFAPDLPLTCNDIYKPFIGKTGVVTNTHEDYPQFARVEFKDTIGYRNALHWPVKVVREQLKLNAFKETPEYTKSLFKEILNLTKTK